jgi:aclacinomycin oxidase
MTNTQQPATFAPSARVGNGLVTPEDPRYGQLLHRNFKRRFVGRPDYVRLVGTAEQVVQAVQEAVDQKRRVVARSGGCCLEGFMNQTVLLRGVNDDARVLTELFRGMQRVRVRP